MESDADDEDAGGGVDQGSSGTADVDVQVVTGDDVFVVEVFGLLPSAGLEAA